MSPAVERWRTARTAAQRRAQLGEHHPGTWAAFARAHVAWGGWRGLVDGKAPKLDGLHDADPRKRACAASYTTADLRVRGMRGYNNRHERKRERRARAVPS